MSCWDLAFRCFVLNDPLCRYIFVTEEHARTRQCGFSDFPRPLTYSLWTKHSLVLFLACLLVSPSSSFRGAGDLNEGSSWGPAVVFDFHLRLLFLKVSFTCQRSHTISLFLVYISHFSKPFYICYNPSVRAVWGRH